ncbi:hypothetical protein Ct9H90mP29_03700 [bacterium]|nr:MAG: hypothetical protein Ct9H90mP29_03700 [bacterium]
MTGISRALGGKGGPSPVTGLGTFSGIKATVKKQLGKNSLFGFKREGARRWACGVFIFVVI